METPVGRASARRGASRRTEVRPTGTRTDRQRGWAGIVILLVVVLIVAVLYKDALTKYLGPAQTVPRAGPRTPVDSATGDATAPTPANAVDRARGLQDFMQKESQKRGGD